ncbi:MAG TPA: DUF6232 family protein [Allosphingosinicella sp.]|nr:DUF6232 family protein [Allosphingosinicella sp.]
MAEEVFFEQGNVKVTNARFIVDAQTYAMNGVTSVKSHVVPPSRGGVIAAIAVGLLMVFVADGAMKLVGAAIAAGGVWFFTQQKATHSVFLSSASGEVQALSDTDEGYIGSVVNALNEALVHRG